MDFKKFPVIFFISIITISGYWNVLGAENPKSTRETTSVAVSKKEKEKLEKKEEGLKKLEKDIKFAAFTQRIEAMQRVPGLDEEQHKRYIPLIESAYTNSPDPLVRKVSIETLGKIKAQAAIETITKALQDSDKDVVRASIGSLATLKAKEKSPDIFEVTKTMDYTDNNNLVLQSAINTLGKFEYTDAATFFLEKLKRRDTKPDMRRYLILYFGYAKASAGVTHLIELLKNEDEEYSIREYSANSLGKIKDRTALPALKETLSIIKKLPSAEERARSSRLKLQIIAAMVRMGDTSVSKELLLAARDDNAGLRFRAVKYLGELKTSEARELLEYKAEFDPDHRVRKAAKEALDIMDGKKSDESSEDEM